MPNDSVTWPLPGPSASSQAGGRLAPLWLWGGGRQSARGVGLRAGRVPWPRSQRPPLLTGSSSRGRSGAGGEATAAAWGPRGVHGGDFKETTSQQRAARENATKLVTSSRKY